MQHNNHLSIRIKIILLIVFVSTINVVIASIIQFYFEKELYNKEIKEKLRILTDVIGESNSATIIFNNEKEGLNYLSALKADKHVKNAIILRPDSTLFVEYNGLHEGDDGESHFVHIKHFPDHARAKKGDTVTFEIGTSKKGRPCALDVRLANPDVMEVAERAFSSIESWRSDL